MRRNKGGQSSARANESGLTDDVATATGPTVSYGTGISELFVRLGQTGSLETALSDGVRLACEAAGCAAGALVAEFDVTSSGSHSFHHDPHGLLARVTGDDATLEAQDAAGRGSNGVVRGAGRGLREVWVPLCCAGQSVGWLLLLAPQTVSDEQCQIRIAGINAVLGVLMAATESGAARSLSAVLSRAAFRVRLVSEISRSERCGDELSVLHLRVAGMPRPTSENGGLWANVAALGEALAVRLRASDVVGLLAPDHVAVLLTGTGRLGGRIAARRIEQLLRMPENDSSSRRDLGVVSPGFCLKTFPEDARDVDSLCRVQRWSSETIGPVAVAVNSK